MPPGQQLELRIDIYGGFILLFSISESDYVNYLVDKIASFFEREENWSMLKGCWLENGKSNCFRKLLHEALKEVNLNVFESYD